jgi:hypothetical protein
VFPMGWHVLLLAPINPGSAIPGDPRLAREGASVGEVRGGELLRLAQFATFSRILGPSNSKTHHNGPTIRCFAA